MEEKKWIDVGPILSQRYFLDRRGHYQNIKGCENWEITDRNYFSYRGTSYVQYKREKTAEEPDTSELKWIELDHFTDFSENEDIEGCEDFKFTHNWFKRYDGFKEAYGYFYEFKRKDLTQKKWIDVGPDLFWNQRSFLANQEKLKNFQGCEEIFNWKMTGKWFFKDGTYYVEYEREKEEDQEDYSETKWVKNGSSIHSHKDFLNRWNNSTDLVGCEGFEKTGRWFLNGRNAFVQYEKIRPGSNSRNGISDASDQNNYFEDPAFQVEAALKDMNLHNVVWKRPHEIVDNPKMYVGDGSKNDINQGQIGNCWFVAALATFCQNDELLKRVCPDQTLDPSDEDYDGLIKIRFWQYGEWVEVIIDDRLPYNESRDELYFVDSDTRNEFWPALIEKAYAKLHLSYKAIVGGLGTESMTDLTGGFSKKHMTKFFNDHECFDLLQETLDDGGLITVYTPGSSDTVIKEGLAASHAYTLTKVEKLTFKNEKKLCVRIRNPWGSRTEWTGELNDSDGIWNECKSDVSLVKGDGEFWMTISDFKKRFSGFSICWLDKSDSLNSEGRWIERTMEGEWCIDQGTAGGCGNHKDTHCNNPFMTFTVTGEKDSNECIFALQHKYRRILKKHEGRDLSKFFIGYTVYKINADFDSENPSLKELLDNSERVNRGTVMFQYNIVVNRDTLPGAGRYIVVPSTFHQNQEGEFFLRVYVEKEDFCKIKYSDEADSSDSDREE